MEYYGYVFIGILVGAIIGLIPLYLGAVKGSIAIGIVSFVLCAICGAIGGLLLSAPVSAFFTYYIMKKSIKEVK